MKEKINNEEGRKPRFTACFPGRVSEDLMPAEALETEDFAIEGEVCKVVPTGHTDTDETSPLYVPSLRLAVTGDTVHNHVHPFLMETETRRKLDQWLKALDIVEALDPQYVVGGHKDPARSDHPDCIDETRRYFGDLLRLSEQCANQKELHSAMLEIHGTRLNPGSLWGRPEW